jgi:acyl-CoA thioesterase-1
VLALLLLAAAGGRPAAAAERVLVAFGDSLTAGYGVPREESYPAQLERRLRAAGYAYRVVNAGVSGDTTAGALRRVDWALRSQPDVVVVVLGANDGLRGQDLRATRDNLAAIVARFQEAGARVLLGGMRLPPNYGAAYDAAFRRVYEAVARERRVPLVPFFLDGVAGDRRLNLPDGIHPTGRGYAVIVERLWPHLEPLLAR